MGNYASRCTDRRRQFGYNAQRPRITVPSAAKSGVARAALAAVLLLTLLAGCDLFVPESIRVTAPEPTFQIRVEFEGGDPDSYEVTFDPPAAATGGVAAGDGTIFLSEVLRYADFATSDSDTDPVVIRVRAERENTDQRLSVTITQIESSMTPPGEHILYEKALPDDSDPEAGDNPTLEIELTQPIPGS